MPDSSNFTPSPVFDLAAQTLDLAVESLWFNTRPAEQAAKLGARMETTASLLEKAADLQHVEALEAVAHALRFPSSKDLSDHLARARGFAAGRLPAGWLDALGGSVVLLVQAEDEVMLPAAQLDAFEHFGETLAMLTDAPKQRVLDGVCAALCGARTWCEIRGRSPLKAVTPLYTFVVPDDASGDDVGGFFDESPACRQLTDDLDDRWQGYDNFTKPQKRAARRWVESALTAEPGFLEGGLALAWMQHDAGEPAALATARRFVRQAEALIPKGFKGRILWGHLGNRFYHRLLWLLLQVNHEHGLLAEAARLARKQLRLNPGDNLGLRYVLPLLLLERGDVAAARRSLKALADEPALTAAAIRAFVAFAEDDRPRFRRELAAALFSLPVLRTFLLNDPKALAAGESGFRAVQPDMEDFARFAWPTYCTLPGLRRACIAFLSEPEVLKAEADLRAYWDAYWNSGRRPQGARTGSAEGWDKLVRQSLELVAPLTRGPGRR